MLHHMIEWVIKHRWLVLALGGVLAVVGLISLSQLPFDAMPDITPVMVQVNTSIPGYAPEDVESQVTMSVERELSGLAGLHEIRSISKFGLSQVTCVFEEGADVYRARQQVSERLSTVELPASIDRPRLGP